MRTVDQIIEDNGYDLEDCEIIVFRNPDYTTALIGISDDNCAIYDYEKMIDYLTRYEDMDEEEAADFISYNTIRSLSYISGNKPIVLYPFYDTKD